MHLSEDIEQMENNFNLHNCMGILLRGTSKFFPLVVRFVITSLAVNEKDN